jgi:integrase
LRGRLEIIIDAARALGHIHESTANPARWRGHLDKLLARRTRRSRGHFAALPWPQAPAFMAALRAEDNVSARALEFTILTAARSGETRLATIEEFDLEAAVWTVPADRMKAGRTHRVPLPPRAIEIVSELREAFPAARYVFPGSRPGRPLSDMSLTMFLRRRNMPTTAHGFRSTFRDWAGEATAFARELAEAALAHVIGDQTEAAYRRGDALERRRELMNAWAAFLDGDQGAKVIPLRPIARKAP